jgi:hypothetical protein
MSNSVDDKPREGDSRITLGECVRVGVQLAEVCDAALLSRLPFEAGFSNPARVRRARELAAQLNLAMTLK